ncbi:MAG: homoserine kinase [Chloroflexi bacterium]|nr:homoserine kinase [Chloroflexota bacterium]
MKIASVAVTVPASTSNLGSGFDTLGLALNLYNRIVVTRRAETGVKFISAPPADDDGKAAAMVAEAARLFFQKTRQSPFGLEVSISGDIPMARGLGASATVRLGLLAALNELARTRWNRQQLLELATALERHPDNASPAALGGFTVSGMVGKAVRCLRFPVSPRARFVTLIPAFPLSTDQARAVMPDGFHKADTLHSLNRAALITAAFAGGSLEVLRGLFDDRVHQPYRATLIPQLSHVIRAGEEAGAIGGWLSGAGSGIICLTFHKADQIAQAMQKELPDSDVRILTAENQGFRVETNVPPPARGSGVKG